MADVTLKVNKDDEVYNLYSVIKNINGDNYAVPVVHSNLPTQWKTTGRSVLTTDNVVTYSMIAYSVTVSIKNLMSPYNLVDTDNEEYNNVQASLDGGATWFDVMPGDREDFDVSTNVILIRRPSGSAVNVPYQVSYGIMN